ncbi:hypothetical protein CaldiYA01_04670 [Caldicellulosiruptor diazotrophicus]|uniref:Uncharacterized protein n=1 Tax=Caldicellulosiruptor diazotrophicus TaxID=2806205 RepID=A0ABM7NK88_9FIRM|nr:hypothetical protein CaldiYA01_04670 [Caldicellulosiruptor diazotrophicus]
MRTKKINKDSAKEGFSRCFLPAFCLYYQFFVARSCFKYTKTSNYYMSKMYNNKIVKLLTLYVALDIINLKQIEFVERGRV